MKAIANASTGTKISARYTGFGETGSKSNFHNPKGSLTNTQLDIMAKNFAKSIRVVKDADGKSKFRFGNTTHVVQYADGRELPQVVKNSVDNSENIADNEVNDIVPEVSDNGDRVSARQPSNRLDVRDRQRRIYPESNGIISRDEQGRNRENGRPRPSMALNDKHSDKLSAFSMAEDKVQYIRDLISDAGVEVIIDPEEVERVWKESYKSPLNEVTGFKSPDGKIYINVNHPEFQELKYHQNKQTTAALLILSTTHWKLLLRNLTLKAKKSSLKRI